MTVAADESWVRCPVCGVGVLLLEQADPDTGMVTGTCGHVGYSGYLAELLYLQRRSTWLADRIRDGGPAPAPEIARAYAVWDVRPAAASAAAVAARTPVSGGAGGGRRATRARPGPGLQGLLLGLGALLLVVAAVVFTAVAWPRLGALGQVAVVLLATVGTAVAAARLRQRLRGTAEALAVVAVGLAVVTVAAGPGLGLLPAGWLEPDSGYWTIALLGLGALAVVGGRRVGLQAWSWLGWLLLGVALLVTAGTVVGALGASPALAAGAFGVAAALGCVLGTASWWLPELVDDRGPLLLAGAGVVLVAGSVVAGLAVSREALPSSAAAAALVGVTLVGLARAVPAESATARRVLAVAGAAVLAAAFALVLAIPEAGLVTALAAATAGLVVLLVGITRSVGGEALVVATALWVTWTVMTAPTDALVGDGPGAATVAWGAFLVVVGTGLVLAGRLADDWLRWLPWAGAVLVYAGLVVVVPDEYPDLVEAWTLPLAALLAIAGYVSTRGRDVSSSLRWGPAVTVALVPSAFATWSAPWVTSSGQSVGVPLLRLLLVLVVGAAVLVVGARLRAAGLVVPAAAAVAIATLAQVWTGLQALPRYVALALVGAVLVGAGARFEWLRSEGRRAGAWVRGLE